MEHGTSVRQLTGRESWNWDCIWSFLLLQPDETLTTRLMFEFSPIDTAVSCESPVIILMATPELMSVPTASLTPDLGGSMMPTRPRKVKFPISAPDANARTTERDGRVQCSWADSVLIFSPVFRLFYLWVRRCPCSWSAAGTAPSAGGWATVRSLCCCRSCRVGSPARTLPSWSKLRVCPDDVKNRAEDDVRRYKSHL